MLSLSLFTLIVIACMWTWMIYLYFAWLYVAWLPSSMWLHVACLCGPHIYPLTSNPLVSIISFIPVLTFASVRPCVCFFLGLSPVLVGTVFRYSYRFYLIPVLARILPFFGTHTDSTLFRYSRGQFFNTRTDSTFSQYSPGFYHFRYSHRFDHFLVLVGTVFRCS